MWIPILISAAVLAYSQGYYGLAKYAFTGNYYDRYNVSRKQRGNEAFVEAILNDKYRYYQSLSPKGRNKFLARLSKVMDRAEFIGHGGLEITDEIRVCVLFAKIQLTYGLDLFHFRRFKRYILYPESFYSRFFEAQVKGLTSGAGFVSLSWRDFQQGYLVHDDQFNLGLHEMAHALRIELMQSDDLHLKTRFFSERMDERAFEELELAKRGVPTMLRSYALTNDEEFFAVCVECFFEVPALLKERKPEIFRTLCHMLNQNPLNVDGDYRWVG